MLDNFTSEYAVYSHRNLFLTQYLTLNRLLKLNFPRYYKYNYNIYHFLKKFLILNYWRVYIKPCTIFNLITPVYKFHPQIQLKEFLFYKNITETSFIKGVLPLHKKKFNIIPSLKIQTKLFMKKLPGGLNYLVRTNTNNALYDSNNKHFINQIVFKQYIKFKEIYDFFILKLFLDLLFWLSMSNVLNYYQTTIYCIVYRL